VKFAEEAAEPGYAARGPGERPVGVEAIGPAGATEIGPAGPGSESGAPLHPGTDAPPVTELLAMALSEESWETFSRGSAIRRQTGMGRGVRIPSPSRDTSTRRDGLPGTVCPVGAGMDSVGSLVRGTYMDRHPGIRLATFRAYVWMGTLAGVPV
jgi:hypothetical protein